MILQMLHFGAYQEILGVDGAKPLGEHEGDGGGGSLSDKKLYVYIFKYFFCKRLSFDGR